MKKTSFYKKKNISKNYFYQNIAFLGLIFDTFISHNFVKLIFKDNIIMCFLIVDYFPGNN